MPSEKTSYSTLISICSVLFILFFGIWYSVFIGEFSGILSLDEYINSHISTLHSYVLTPPFLLVFISSVFDPVIFLTWFLVLIAFLWIKNFKFEAIFLFLGVGGGQVVKIIIKYLTDRERPENPFDLFAHESSFPSGHSTTAVFFFLSVLYLFTGRLQKTQKFLARGFLILGVLLVPFSRVYEQVHYFSDVVAGSLLGIFSLSFTVLVFMFCRDVACNVSAFSHFKKYFS